jgi:hypothetical protein
MYNQEALNLEIQGRQQKLGDQLKHFPNVLGIFQSFLMDLNFPRNMGFLKDIIIFFNFVPYQVTLIVLTPSVI